jgi:hypothetical protein
MPAHIDRQTNRHACTYTYRHTYMQIIIIIILLIIIIIIVAASASSPPRKYLPLLIFRFF